MKKTIRLTENDLHRIIKESVKRIKLNENIESLRELEQPYKELMYVLNKFNNILYAVEEQDKEFFNNSRLNELLEATENVSTVGNDVFMHPDVGGSTKVWDNVGF